MTTESSGAIPGWYGKLPNLGDFASRRLPAEFIRTWDTWLQEVLHSTRASLGEGWRDRYLTMPIWRFVLMPGLVEASGWAGVLMPSVDRVGRQFPLTLAVALASETEAAHAVFEGADWFASLENAALGVLDPTRSPDELEQALESCAFVAPLCALLEGPAGAVRRLPSTEAFESLAMGEALRAWSRDAGWKGLWWTQGRVEDHPLMLTCAKLPTAEEFGWLLQSRASLD
ncbi:MAG TPA: type VI secretion system-associated protein TagF [Candidatus Methylomirabilis sp.]|nr:type VI secretion system-associated protein TagF [Candidatus Methylomirabilis sp.]